VPALADDPALEGLRSTLVTMRGRAPEGPVRLRAATPQLTVSKHQLRDWLESRLSSFGERGDEVELSRKLNAELRQAQLVCSDCGENLSGFLVELTIRRSGGFLVVTAGVGILCGYDESAYLYRWKDGRWVRVWQNEQNTYNERDYQPQALSAVLVSSDSKGDDYVLTLGHETWCASNWHNVYHRLFRLDSSLEGIALVDEGPWAYLGAHIPPINGSGSGDDILVEFTLGSLDVTVHSREAIRHYKMENGQARRVAPFALSPRDFVEEWLTTPWSESAAWTERANRGSVQAWHKKEVDGGEFRPTMHCPTTPDLWQVGLESKDFAQYFLVRWRPPYQFSMVRASARPYPGCTAQDNAADERRTLFPGW
jgi:hypothetical protein